MKKLIAVFALFIPLMCLAGTETSERNMWYAPDLTEIFGFDLTGKAVYSKGFGSIIEIEHQDLGNGHYTFTPTKQFPYRSAEINQTAHTITLKSNGISSTLSQVPNVKSQDMVGKWFFYKKDEQTEWSAIITRRATDYDYDYVYLDHTNKTYAITTKADFGVKYQIHNGWQIYENGELAFIITAFSKDRMDYADTYGEKFVEVRYTDQSNITIPEGYSPEE